jgi:hypothetical protein
MEQDIARISQTAIDLTNVALRQQGASIEDARGFMAGILDQYKLTDKTIRSMRHLNVLVKQDLSDFMLSSSARSELPNFVQEISNPDQARRIRDAVYRQLGGKGKLKGMQLGVGAGVRVHGLEFARLTLEQLREGVTTGQAFDIFMPVGRAARYGVQLTSQYSMFQLPQIAGRRAGPLQVSSMAAALQRGMGEGGYFAARKALLTEQAALRSFGTQVWAHETQGERLIRHLAAGHSYPAQALENARRAVMGMGAVAVEGDELMKRFLAHPTAEPLRPATSVRGGIAAGRGLGLLYGGMEWMNWSSDPRQSIRDINWIPSLHAEKLWGVDNAKDNIALSTNTAYAGPGQFYNRFRPVNPGRNWEKVMRQKYQYMAPHTLQLHVTGDKAADVLRKYGVSPGMGEVFARADIREALVFEQMKRIDVTRPNEAIAKMFTEGGYSTVKPMPLEAGTWLGATRTGKFEVTRDLGDLELLGFEERQGRTTFHIRQKRTATEAFKIQQGAAGGVKATLKFRDKRFIDSVISETLFGLSSKGLNTDRRELVRHLDLISSTSGVFKQGRYGLAVQMTGALRHLVAQQMDTGYNPNNRVHREAVQFLTAKDPFGWLRSQSEAPKFENFVKVVTDYSKKFGITDPEKLGVLFGAGMSGSQTEELRGVVEAQIKKTFSEDKSYKKVIEYAEQGNFITWAPLMAADTPWDAKGRASRLEIRTIERLMETSWKLGDTELNEALYTGIMKGAPLHDPSKLKTLEYTERAWQAAIGQLPLERLDDDVKRMNLTTAVNSEVSQTGWFRGKGAVLEMPEGLREAARNVGMGEHLYIPGEAAVGRDLVSREAKVHGIGATRDAEGRLIKQHYSSFIDDAMREIGNVIVQGDMQAKENALKNLQSGMFGYYRKAVQDVLRTRLGPGSGHVQAVGISDYAAQVKAAEWRNNPLLKEEAIRNIGENLVEKYEQGGFRTERQVFLSRAQAREMVRDVDFSKLDVTKDEFIKGRKGLFGMVWRNPTIMQTSIQPAEVFVAQGAQPHVPRIMVPQRLADGREIGIAPGMKLDFDKDMLNIKLITDEGSVRILQGSKEQWTALERAYEKNVVDRQVLADALSVRMKKIGFDRVAKDTLRDDFVKQWGEKGSELYEKALGAHRMRTGKDVGGISKVVEEIMFAMGRPGGDTDMNVLVNMILSEAMETGTLKARKAAGRVIIAENLRKAFKSAGPGDIEAFAGVLHEEFLGGDFAKATTYEFRGETRSLKPVNEVFDYMIRRYNQYKGTSAQNLFRSFFTGRDMPMQAKIAAGNMILTGTDGSHATSFLAGVRGNMAGKFNVMSELGLSAANTGAISEGAAAVWKQVTKRIPGPMMLGLLGSAAAFSVIGSPGPAAPLGPPINQRMDPNTLGLQTQALGGRGQPQLQAMLPQGGGPSVTGQLSTPAAPVAPMVNQVSVNVPSRDMMGLDYNGISRALRSILPSGNISSRISDSRRPMTPNDLYRDGF